MLHPMKLKRLEKELSQYALSFQSRVPQVKICYAEKGFPVLNDRQKEAIAKVLNCSVDNLFPRNSGEQNHSESSRRGDDQQTNTDQIYKKEMS